MIQKLDANQKHLLRLIVRDCCADGWAVVSKPVFPLMNKLPRELVELELVGDEGRGRVRLTEQGQSVMDAMSWLL